MCHCDCLYFCRIVCVGRSRFCIIFTACTDGRRTVLSTPAIAQHWQRSSRRKKEAPSRFACFLKAVVMAKNIRRGLKQMTHFKHNESDRVECVSFNFTCVVQHLVSNKATAVTTIVILLWHYSCTVCTTCNSSNTTTILVIIQIYLLYLDYELVCHVWMWHQLRFSYLHQHRIPGGVPFFPAEVCSDEAPLYRAGDHGTQTQCWQTTGNNT